MEDIPETVEAFVVISCWEEPSYAAEPSYMPRTCLCHTVHDSEDEALTRAESEAEFCLIASQARIERRCALLAVAVPRRMLDHDGGVHPWVSDRMSELARRAGLIERPEPSVMVSAAFEAAKGKGGYRLPFLQAAAACRNGSNGALPSLLRTIAGMPRDAATALEASVQALLPPKELLLLAPPSVLMPEPRGENAA